MVCTSTARAAFSFRSRHHRNNNWFDYNRFQIILWSNLNIFSPRFLTRTAYHFMVRSETRWSWIVIASASYFRACDQLFHWHTGFDLSVNHFVNPHFLLVAHLFAFPGNLFFTIFYFFVLELPSRHRDFFFAFVQSGFAKKSHENGKQNPAMKVT